MATLFLVDSFGKRTGPSLALQVSVGKLDYRPEQYGGHYSWEEHYPYASYKLPVFAPHIIIAGSAKIYLNIGQRDGSCSALIVRIESPSASDLERAISLVIAYVGGKVCTFDMHDAPPSSFIGGIVNDVRVLSGYVKRGIRALRQHIGFRIAV